MATSTIVVTIRIAPWRVLVARAFVHACIPLALVFVSLGGTEARAERWVRAVLSPFLRGGISVVTRPRSQSMQPVFDLLKSKKFLTAILGLVALAVAHFARMPEERITEIVGLFAALLLGQGAASFGKEAKATREKMAGEK